MRAKTLKKVLRILSCWTISESKSMHKSTFLFLFYQMSFKVESHVPQDPILHKLGQRLSHVYQERGRGESGEAPGEAVLTRGVILTKRCLAVTARRPPCHAGPWREHRRPCLALGTLLG